MKKVVAEGGEELSKRLKRLIEDEERTMAKLEELQTHLKEVRIARKQEEDQEIVRSIRTMKLGARDLMELLSGIQSGSISIETLPVEDEKEDVEEEAAFTDAKHFLDVKDGESGSEKITGAEKAPESEENIHE